MDLLSSTHSVKSRSRAKSRKDRRFDFVAAYSVEYNTIVSLMGKINKYIAILYTKALRKILPKSVGFISLSAPTLRSI